MADSCCEIPPGGDDLDVEEGWRERCRTVAAVAAAVLWLAGVLISRADHPGVADGLYIAAIVVGGATFARRNPKSLKSSAGCRFVDDDRSGWCGCVGRVR